MSMVPRREDPIAQRVIARLEAENRRLRELLIETRKAVEAVESNAPSGGRMEKRMLALLREIDAALSPESPSNVKP